MLSLGGFTGPGESFPRGASWCHQLAGGCSFFSHGPLCMAASCFPRANEALQRQKPPSFYDLGLEVTHWHFGRILLLLFFFFLVFFFFFFGLAHGMQKFLGQELNPHHSSNLSCCSENVRSLRCCTTRNSNSHLLSTYHVPSTNSHPPQLLLSPFHRWH